MPLKSLITSSTYLTPLVQDGKHLKHLKPNFLLPPLQDHLQLIHLLQAMIFLQLTRVHLVLGRELICHLLILNLLVLLGYRLVVVRLRNKKVWGVRKNKRYLWGCLKRVWRKFKKAVLRMRKLKIRQLVFRGCNSWSSQVRFYISQYKYRFLQRNLR